LHAASGTKKGIRSENPAVVLYGHNEKTGGCIFKDAWRLVGFIMARKSALQVHRGRLAPNTQELIQILFSISYFLVVLGM
jgi:hypothetical protein